MSNAINILIAVVVCCVPLLIHWLNDRKGDTRKLNDLFVLVPLAFLLSFVVWNKLEIAMYRTLALMAGIHTLFFDYAINYSLYKNEVIERPEAKRWFSYTGLSSELDKWQWWIGIGKWGRFSVRMAIFLISIIIFCWPAIFLLF